MRVSLLLSRQLLDQIGKIVDEALQEFLRGLVADVALYRRIDWA